jgi:hypothetical protein
MVRCMGMKLLKSKSDYSRRTQYTEGALYPLCKLELDVEIEKVDNRCENTLTEAGTKKP